MKMSRLLSFVVIVGLTAGVQAQATRTWVSGVGDDVNPCSRTAPCKTFAGAVSKTAAGGEINVLDPGGFGTITITKSLTIDGIGAQASLLAAGATFAVSINVPSSTDVVTLRNLSLNGAGTGVNGIRIINTAPKAVHIENCVIFGFSGRGIDVANTTGNARVFIKDTVVRNTGGNGIHGSGSGGSSVNLMLERVTVNQSGATAFFAGTNTTASLFNSSFSGSLVGVDAGVSGALVNVEGSSVTFNATAGLRSVAGGTLILSRNSVSANGIGVQNNGATFTLQTSAIAGNTGDVAGNPFNNVAPR